ncbi:MAG TPA: hypothetical protein VF812_18725 [Ktedonobacterales bacterium]
MASEEAPGRWSDDVDDDLVVTREWLDEASQRARSRWPRIKPPITFLGRQTLPATGASAATRGMTADTTSETPPISDEHANREGASGAWDTMRIGWERSLTPRQKALRAGGISLLILLTLYTLLGGPAATVDATQRLMATIDARLHPPKPLPTLAERGFVPIKSPPGAYNLPEMSVAPETGQSEAAWACWATPYSSGGQRGGWHAHAYYTATSGAHWSAVTLPETTAQACDVYADGEAGGRALFVLAQGLAPDGSCMSPFLYLTGGDGATMTHVPWPLSPSDSVCQFDVALEGAAIYVWSHNPLLRGTNPYLPPTGRLIVSRDLGQTWASADYGLDDSTGLDIVGFRPGGRILATIADAHTSGSAARLMESDNYGASWRDYGDLPGAFPQVFVSTDSSVSDHGGWGRLYLQAEMVSTGAPAVLLRGYLATAYLGQTWTSLPLPPLLAGTESNEQSREPIILGLGPAGSLEVERGIVESANAQLSPSRRLWVWDSAFGEWLLDPQTIPGNLELQGVSWRAGSQTFWMTTLQLGVPPVLQLYTKMYPTNLLRRGEKPAH